MDVSLVGEKRDALIIARKRKRSIDDETCDDVEFDCEFISEGSESESEREIAYCRKCSSDKCEKAAYLNAVSCIPLSEEEIQLAKTLINPEAKITIEPLFSEDTALEKRKNLPRRENKNIAALRKRDWTQVPQIYCCVCYGTECVRVMDCNELSCDRLTEEEQKIFETLCEPAIVREFVEHTFEVD